MVIFMQHNPQEGDVFTVAAAMDPPRGDNSTALGIPASDLRCLDAVCASFRADWQLYRHAVVRLKTPHDVMGSLGARERKAVARDVEQQYRDCCALWSCVSCTHFRSTGLPQVWDSSRTCVTLTRIDSLYEVLGVGEAAQLADWRSSLNGHRLARERWLEERFDLLTDGMLFNHVPSETKRREALTTPQNQLQV